MEQTYGGHGHLKKLKQVKGNFDCSLNHRAFNKFGGGQWRGDECDMLLESGVFTGSNIH